jgi:hypothetical protein
VQKELSFMDIFQYYLSLSEKGTSAPAAEGEHKRSYTLLEDLRIVLVSQSFDEVKNRDYKQFESRVPGRTHQSIRDRFLYFLRYLTREDFDKIVKHLQSHGPSGYLLFSTGAHKRLINVIFMYAYSRRRLSSKTPRLRRCKSSEGNSTKNSQAKRK